VALPEGGGLNNGRPAHPGFPHRLRPDTSPHALRISPRGEHPALQGLYPGRRGVTPVFGYDAPHPSVRGTSTLLNSALLGAHYGPVRLPISVHRRLRSFDCPTRSVHLAITEADGISRFPSKVHPYMRGVFDRAGSQDVLPGRRPECCLPPISRTSAPRSNPPRGGALISQLNTQPARSPVNASPETLRTPMHDSGPMWLARPSMYKTFIYNTLPV
jgi:hypothetical protein